MQIGGVEAQGLGEMRQDVTWEFSEGGPPDAAGEDTHRTVDPVVSFR